MHDRMGDNHIQGWGVRLLSAVVDLISRAHAQCQLLCCGLLLCRGATVSLAVVTGKFTCSNTQ